MIEIMKYVNDPFIIMFWALLMFFTITYLTSDKK